MINYNKIITTLATIVLQTAPRVNTFALYFLDRFLQNSNSFFTYLEFISLVLLAVASMTNC